MKDNYQNIPLELMLHAMRSAASVMLREFMKLRFVALRKGSYFSLADYRQAGTTSSTISRLIRLGWIERVNKGHYRMNSVYKICIKENLSITLNISFKSDELESAAMEWKGNLLARAEAYVLRRNIASDRDGVTKRETQNVELLSCRYMAKVTGYSYSAIAAYRRKFNFNIYTKIYDPSFDSRQIKSKKDLMFYLDTLRMSDLTEQQKEAGRNIIFCKRLKIYRVVLGTRVQVHYLSLISDIRYNNSRCGLKKRYRSNPFTVVL